MPVPVRINDWTFNVIADLCKVGHGESDRHDFKSRLPDADSVTKLCCAFANSQGGFVVVGVHERFQAGVKGFAPDGIEPEAELALHLATKIQASPSIVALGPEVIEVPGTSKFIYVFEIQRSSFRPHLPTIQAKQFFWKKIPGGCEYMTLDEIRGQILAYEERQERLRLLVIDLAQNLERLIEYQGVPEGKLAFVTLDSSVLDRLLVDIYTQLRTNKELLGILALLRKEYLAVNNHFQLTYARFASTSNPASHKQIVGEQKQFLMEKVQLLRPSIERALEVLRDEFGVKDPLA